MSETSFRTLQFRFRAHQANAKQRGIPFLLTFTEWLGIWERSGHLYERGRRKGEYVMARYGDRGAYETGNVHIITNKENKAEGVKYRRLIIEQAFEISANVQLTPEH